MALSPRKEGQLSVKRRLSPATRAVELPVQEFLQRQGIGAIVLFVAAMIALGWANSRWSFIYEDLSHAYFDLAIGPLKVQQSVLHWINDGLMTVFFFLVGMEIKYEVLHGHLSSAKKAALPAIAALGGMMVPAGVYLLFNSGLPSAHGWGIPMATDIAFAVGVLGLLPLISDELRVFLLALAIVDDIGAILVIAIFYSTDIKLLALVLGALVLLVIVLAQWAIPRFGPFHIILGFAFWMCILASGIHAAIAGVILALTVTSKSRFNLEEFDREATTILRDFKQAVRDGEKEKADALLGALETLVVHTDRPIDRVTRTVLPWVTLVVLPLFALANSGVTLNASSILSSVHSRIFWGIAAGLVLGKPLGVALFTWLATTVRIARLPEGTGFREMIGLGTLAGIGFTVAIFIANLAFTDEADLETAKVAILISSFVAGVVGYLLLRFSGRSAPVRETQPVRS